MTEQQLNLGSELNSKIYFSSTRIEKLEKVLKSLVCKYELSECNFTDKVEVDILSNTIDFKYEDIKKFITDQIQSEKNNLEKFKKQFADI